MPRKDDPRRFALLLPSFAPRRALSSSLLNRTNSIFILFAQRQLMVLGLSLGLIGVVTFLHIIGKIVG